MITALFTVVFTEIEIMHIISHEWYVTVSCQYNSASISVQSTVGPKIFTWTIFSDGNYFRIFAYAKSQTVISEYLHSKILVCQYRVL